ncbi:ABC transporter permease [Conexibacter sp. DBS9H8]|uniref:ABC transporter permease n=1 Tax=Conexibacter sp. DBS9H8 TaxID=2937801 RepID=UPI0020107811|nr:ABC transporter permease [Conexibacter sp. DBS9H8]
MIAYIVRRVLVAIVITFFVTLVTYLMLHIIAPSPAYTVLGPKATHASVAAFNRAHGFDKPVLVQFWNYFTGLVLHFNWGFSYKLDQSVWSLFKEDFGRSAYLTIAGLVLAILIAIPLGIFQAIRRNSALDYSMTTLNFVLYSMPSFFLGLILIQVFALDLNVFPADVSDNITTWVQALTHVRQMFLPIITLAAINVASFSRYMRSSALDALAQDYIRLARAKGLSERLVLTRHLVRNAILPMITLIGLSVPALIAGNLLIEVLFNIQGLGNLFFIALGNEDYQILLAYTLFGAFLTVIGNLMADIAMTFADPRIRLD